MHTIRKVASALALSAIVVGGSHSAASAATSYHNEDFSYDYASRTALRTCDQESDSNRTKGGWATSPTGGEVGAVVDADGANGICASSGAGAVIRRHHTCERNHITWDCDNWQAT
jgi:hypothetical protein